MSVMKQGDAGNLYERAVPGCTACTPGLNDLFAIQSAVADLTPPSDGKAQPSYKGFKLQVAGCILCVHNAACRMVCAKGVAAGNMHKTLG